jgi:hypothetical protein
MEFFTHEHSEIDFAHRAPLKCCQKSLYRVTHASKVSQRFITAGLGGGAQKGCPICMAQDADDKAGPNLLIQQSSCWSALSLSFLRVTICPTIMSPVQPSFHALPNNRLHLTSAPAVPRLASFSDGISILYCATKS